MIYICMSEAVGRVLDSCTTVTDQLVDTRLHKNIIMYILRIIEQLFRFTKQCKQHPPYSKCYKCYKPESFISYFQFLAASK